MSRADKLNSPLLIETTYYSISLQSHCTLGGLCKEPKLHYMSGMESGARLERQEQKQGKIEFPSFDFSGFPCPCGRAVGAVSCAAGFGMCCRFNTAASGTGNGNSNLRLYSPRKSRRI